MGHSPRRGLLFLSKRYWLFALAACVVAYANPRTRHLVPSMGLRFLLYFILLPSLQGLSY
jgi:hypothetical protein